MSRTRPAPSTNPAPRGALSSRDNPRVKAARKLARRSVRDETGCFLVEGPSAVSELLGSGLEVVDLFVTPHAASTSPELLEAAAARGVAVHRLSEPAAGSIATTETPQGVVAVARMPVATVADVAASGDLVLVLAHVRDPGNAGTLVRSAVAAGAGGVLFGSESVDPFGPKIVRSAAGTLFRVPVARSVPLPDALGDLRRAGFAAVGTDAGAPASIYEHDLTGRVAIVVGNEAWGLDPRVAADLDHVVSIPMPGPAESLNVAMAGTIVLFEAARQRRERGRR